MAIKAHAKDHCAKLAVDIKATQLDAERISRENQLDAALMSRENAMPQTVLL